MNNIALVKGNIFNSEMETIVNPVNSIGIMGKGLALAFKNKYPVMFKEYRQRCNDGRFEGGTIWLHSGGDKRVLCFATKHHWKSDSRMEYIIDGLNTFIKNYEKMKIKSIAFPMLGCGLGGLNYDAVLQSMKTKLLNVNIPVEIYIR